MLRLYRLAQGLGAPKDTSRAYTLFKEAAERGNNDAMYNIGLMHLNVSGVMWSHYHI